MRNSDRVCKSCKHGASTRTSQEMHLEQVRKTMACAKPLTWSSRNFKKSSFLEVFISWTHGPCLWGFMLHGGQTQGRRRELQGLQGYALGEKRNKCLRVGIHAPVGNQVTFAISSCCIQHRLWASRTWDMVGNRKDNHKTLATLSWGLSKKGR